MDKFKQLVKKSFWGRYFISNLHCLESWLLPILISDEKVVKKYYREHTGKELNLNNPVGFTEKLNWYKLNGRIPLMQTCADKVAVRGYVSGKGFKDNLNEVYAVCNSVKELDIDSYPDCFVIKAAHGSHMNLIVKNKKEINWFKEKLMMATWLRQNIAWSGREWVYKDIPRRLIVEKYLEDESGELRDFKFFCFNGEPYYLQYDVGRFSGKHSRNYYDLNKKLLPIHDDLYPDESLDFPLDDNQFSQMQRMASVLAEPFQFVRVDFYLVQGKIYFGEITFFHNGGVSWFEPNEYDRIFGDKWNIINNI